MGKKLLNIAIFGHDINPAQQYAIIAQEALKRGHRVKAILNRSLFTEKIIDSRTDILVTNVSSSEGGFEELYQGKIASELDIPWIIIGDTHEACTREKANGKVSKATAIVASPEEIHNTIQFGYHDAVYLGGPTTWYDYFFAKPKNFTCLSHTIPTVLIGGIKDAKITDDLLNAFLNACKQTKFKFEVIFKPHPNESADTRNEERRKKLLSQMKLLETTRQLDDLLTEVQLGIFTSGATATIKMACARRPVIYFENQAVRDRIAKENKTGDWYPAKSGACILATADNLAEAIMLLNIPSGRMELYNHQTLVYPEQNEDGPRPEVQIVDFIEELIKHRKE